MGHRGGQKLWRKTKFILVISIQTQNFSTWNKYCIIVHNTGQQIFTDFMLLR